MLASLVAGLCSLLPAVQTNEPISGATLAVRGVDVLIRTSSGATIERGRTVILRGDRIARIQAAAEPLSLPPGAKIIAGKGRTLVPGLVDGSATILDPSDLDRALLAGVTTLRCVDSYGWLQAELAGRDAVGLPSPRCLVFGPDLRRSVARRGARAGEVASWRIGEVVDALVTSQTGRGFDGITLGPDAAHFLVDAAIEACVERGVPLALDTPGKVPLETTLSAGGPLGSLEAVLGAWLALDADGFVEPVPSAKSIAAAAEQVRLSGAAVVTGLTSYDAALSLLDDQEPVRAHSFVRGVWRASVRCQGPLTRAELLHLAPHVRAMWSPAASQLRRSLPLSFRERLRSGRKCLATAATELDARGVPLVIGTGAGKPFVLAGSSVADEIDALVAAGVPRARAIGAATWNAAEQLALETEGEIREGAALDLVLVEGDPLTDPAALRSVVGVVIDGRYVPSQVTAAHLRDAEAAAATEIGFVESVTLLRDVVGAVATARAGAGAMPRETTVRTLCEVFWTHDVPRHEEANALARFATEAWPGAEWPARFLAEQR